MVVVEAAVWLTLAVQRSGKGELHGLAAENLRTALAQLKPDEEAEVAAPDRLVDQSRGAGDDEDESKEREHVWPGALEL